MEEEETDSSDGREEWWEEGWGDSYAPVRTTPASERSQGSGSAESLTSWQPA